MTTSLPANEIINGMTGFGFRHAVLDILRRMN